MWKGTELKKGSTERDVVTPESKKGKKGTERAEVAGKEHREDAAEETETGVRGWHSIQFPKKLFSV